MVPTPDSNLPDVWLDMTPQRESTALGAGIRRTALNSGRAGCSCCHTSVAHPFLRRAPVRSGSLMSIWMRVWRGGQNPLPNPQPPAKASRPCMLPLQAAGEGKEVDVCVGGWVWEATILRERHCKRNQNCIGGPKLGKVLNLKNIGNICTVFARFSREWESRANANERRVRGM